MKQHKRKAPPRQSVTIRLFPDYHVEAFGNPEFIDAKIIRVPWAPDMDSEVWAEEIAEANLPKRFQDAIRADWLRAVDTARPLLANTKDQATATAELIGMLNAPQEVPTWTL